MRLLLLGGLEGKGLTCVIGERRPGLAKECQLGQRR